MTTETTRGSLQRPEVQAVLERLHRAARTDRFRFAALAPRLAMKVLRGRSVTEVLSAGGAKDIFMPVSPEQGRLLYLVARTLGARHIVEFGTSFGISTIYLAAALRDNGGGKVVGSELEPNKHRAATEHLAEAGLADLAEVRLGDALETLRDVPAPIDMVLLDGWKELYMPVLQLLTPRLRKGAVVMADNIKLFRKTLRPYVEYMQSGKNGFQSVTLSIADGFEYSYYEGAGT